MDPLSQGSRTWPFVVVAFAVIGLCLPPCVLAEDGKQSPSGAAPREEQPGPAFAVDGVEHARIVSYTVVILDKIPEDIQRAFEAANLPFYAQFMRDRTNSGNGITKMDNCYRTPAMTDTDDTMKTTATFEVCRIKDGYWVTGEYHTLANAGGKTMVRASLGTDFKLTHLFAEHRNWSAGTVLYELPLDAPEKDLRALIDDRPLPDRKRDTDKTQQPPKKPE